MWQANNDCLHQAAISCYDLTSDSKWSWPDGDTKRTAKPSLMSIFPRAMPLLDTLVTSHGGPTMRRLLHHQVLLLQRYHMAIWLSIVSPSLPITRYGSAASRSMRGRSMWVKNRIMTYNFSRVDLLRAIIVQVVQVCIHHPPTFSTNTPNPWSWGIYHALIICWPPLVNWHHNGSPSKWTWLGIWKQDTLRKHW